MPAKINRQDKFTHYTALRDDGTDPQSAAQASQYKRAGRQRQVSAHQIYLLERRYKAVLRSREATARRDQAAAEKRRQEQEKAAEERRLQIEADRRKEEEYWRAHYRDSNGFVHEGQPPTATPLVAPAPPAELEPRCPVCQCIYCCCAVDQRLVVINSDPFGRDTAQLLKDEEIWRNYDLRQAWDREQRIAMLDEQLRKEGKIL